MRLTLQTAPTMGTWRQQAVGRIDMLQTFLCLALLCLIGLAGCQTENSPPLHPGTQWRPNLKPRPVLDHRKMIEVREAQVTFRAETGPYTTHVTFWYSPNSGRQQADAIVIDAYNMVSGHCAEIHLLSALFGYSGPELKRETVETPDAWYHIYELPASSGAAGVKVYFDATDYHAVF